MSINIPEDDTSLIKLKEAKELSMKIKTVGKDIYQMDRSFNVMEKAAENEGSAGNMINAGLGLGAGLSLGNAMGNQFSQTGINLNTNPTHPPIQTQYFFVIDGKQSSPYTVNDIPSLVSQNIINQDTLAWKQGLNSWDKAISIAELSPFFNQSPPQIPK